MLALMMAAMAEQVLPETTPVFTAFSASTLSPGSCSGTSVATPASVRLAWTVTNPTSSYKVYKDGVLQETVANSPWDMELAGLVEGDPSRQVFYTWTFRVDAILSSGAVGASSEVEISKEYGDCSGIL